MHAPAILPLMLKLRLIVGIIISAFFVGLLWLDTYASGGWPGVKWSTPPGMFVALASVIVIAFALREMQGLLAREGVQISMRITVLAALLCMVWPWIEQVSESIQQKHDEAAAVQTTGAGGINAQDMEGLQRIEASPWYTIGRWFRSVKPHYLVPTILTLSLVAAVVKHSRHQRVEGAMANAGGTLLAIVYLGVLPGFFLPICMTHSAWMVLAIVGVVKAADIGAYATGRLIGRHKLIPWLSPGKTVEGFIGGLVLSSIVGGTIAFWMHIPHVAVPAAVIGGAISGMLLGAVGQLGDLFESLLKRDAGVKDSGAVPGFGGILDILDSPLLAAPVAYWLLKLVLRSW